jgi:hypothetical protein
VIINFLEKYKISHLYVIGGDGTHRGAFAISEEVIKRNLNISVVGIPKTIDNDVDLIDRCVSICISICLYLSMCICIYIYTYACKYSHTYIYICIYDVDLIDRCVYIYVFIFICVRIYIYIYIYKHIMTHYINTGRLVSLPQ